MTRILDNEKYRGHWVWNRWGGRRDPHTGRRRYFEKPRDEWAVDDDEALRIVPQPLWDSVRQCREKVRGTWPGGVGRRGFSREQGSRVKCFPAHLLSGAMVCGRCGASIALVGGKAGGYYGCLAAKKAACDNKLRVRRRLAEKIILDEVGARLHQTEAIHYVFEQVVRELAKLSAHLPETIRLKTDQLRGEQRRLDNLVEFIANGEASPRCSAGAQALVPLFRPSIGFPCSRPSLTNSGSADSVCSRRPPCRGFGPVSGTSVRFSTSRSRRLRSFCATSSGRSRWFRWRRIPVDPTTWPGLTWTR